MGAAITECLPDDHDWQPAGMFGPYPVESCRRCNTGAILPADGYPSPLDAVLGALDRRGCDPRPEQ